MNNLISVIVYFYISAVILQADNQIAASNELKNAYFCAICELVKTGDDMEAKFSTEFPGVDFYRLRPIRVYWGSLKKSEPFLKIHPKPRHEAKRKVFVIFRSEENLIPGDWTKKYINIQEPAGVSSSYLLEGKELITPDELEQFLEKYSENMVLKHPLD
jgi:hypothetical protein